MDVSAIQPDDQLLDMDKVNPFWTTAPTLKHFYNLLFQTSYPLWLWNTMFVAIGATILSIFASVLAAYAIVRLRFRGAAWVGGAFVMSRGGHVRVDILVAHAGARSQRTLTLVDAVLVLIVSLFLSCVSAYAIWDAYQRQVAVVSVVEIPRYVMLAPVFLGAVLLSVERIRRIRELVR
jgi:ABC-type glycerol-3-phosphate transport system permease component